MAEPRRVLQVLGPSTGGIRRHVAFLTAQLRERGWQVEVAGPPGVVDDLDHAIPFDNRLLSWRALRQLVGRYDLVHAHGLTAGWLTALARPLRARVPIVVTVHNVVLDEAAGRAAPVLRVLERLLPKRVNAVIAVSPQIGAYLDGRGAPVTVVGPVGPPPAPARSRHNTRQALGVGDAPLVVCVARLHPQKGLDVLLDAVPRLVDAIPDARIAIVGEGPLEADLRARAAEAVVFAPPYNPADELAAADVVAIPSRWESGPLVLSEALTLGRPVVATPVGSVEQLVVDGQTGWLVPIGDPVALADALADALTNREEAARRGVAGQAKAAAELDPSARVSGVEAVYRASLNCP